MNNPIQPSEALLTELGRRVAYRGLKLLDNEFTKIEASAGGSFERIEAIANAVHAASQFSESDGGEPTDLG